MIIDKYDKRIIHLVNGKLVSEKNDQKEEKKEEKKMKTRVEEAGEV
jgi:hypothetical protein